MIMDIIRDPLFIAGAILVAIAAGKHWPWIVGVVFIVLSIVT